MPVVVYSVNAMLRRWSFPYVPYKLINAMKLDFNATTAVAIPSGVVLVIAPVLH
jgi:hypothetical protein